MTEPDPDIPALALFTPPDELGLDELDDDELGRLRDLILRLWIVDAAVEVDLEVRFEWLLPMVEREQADRQLPGLTDVG